MGLRRLGMPDVNASVAHPMVLWQMKDILMPVFTSATQLFTSPHLHSMRAQKKRTILFSWRGQVLVLSRSSYERRDEPHPCWTLRLLFLPRRWILTFAYQGIRGADGACGCGRCSIISLTTRLAFVNSCFTYTRTRRTRGSSCLTSTRPVRLRDAPPVMRLGAIHAHAVDLPTIHEPCTMRGHHAGWTHTV